MKHIKKKLFFVSTLPLIAALPVIAAEGCIFKYINRGIPESSSGINKITYNPNNPVNKEKIEKVKTLKVEINGRTFTVQGEDSYNEKEVFYGSDVLEEVKGKSKFYEKIPKLNEIGSTGLEIRVPTLEWISRYIQSLWLNDFRDFDTGLKYSKDNKRALSKSEYIQIIDKILSYLSEKIDSKTLRDNLITKDRLKRMYGEEYNEKNLNLLEAKHPWLVYFQSPELVGKQTKDEKIYFNDSAIGFFNNEEFVYANTEGFKNNLLKDFRNAIYSDYLNTDNNEESDEKVQIDEDYLRKLGWLKSGARDLSPDNIIGLAPTDEKSPTEEYEGKRVKVASVKWKLDRNVPSQNEIGYDRFRNETFLSELFYLPVTNIQNETPMIFYDVTDTDTVINWSVLRAGHLQVKLYKDFLNLLKELLTLDEKMNSNKKLIDNLKENQIIELLEKYHQSLLDFIKLDWIPGLTVEQRKNVHPNALIMPGGSDNYNTFAYHNNYKWALNQYQNFTSPLLLFFMKDEKTFSAYHNNTFSRKGTNNSEIPNLHEKYEVIWKFLKAMDNVDAPYLISNSETEVKTKKIIREFKNAFNWRFKDASDFET